MSPMYKRGSTKHHGLKRSYIILSTKFEKGQICTTIKHLAPTIQIFSKVELEILKGHLFALMNPLVPFLSSSLPTSQGDYLPNS